MHYKVTKLDKRYTFRDQFPYMIDFPKAWVGYSLATPDHNSGVLAFDRARRWFNETYGYTQDVETRGEMIKTKKRMQDEDWAEINQEWSYSIRYQEYRIYITESALTMFKLKWGNGDSFTA